MSTCAQRALIVTFSPDPCLRGRVPLGVWSVPAVLSFDLALFYSRALGPTNPKFAGGPLQRTPPGVCLPVWCGGCRFSALSNCPAATVIPSQAVSVQRRHFEISDQAGDSVPEARRMQDLVFRAAGCKCLSFRRASPVMGAWGQAAYERPLREGAHRRRPPAHLWLLSVRAESNTCLFQPRRAEPSLFPAKIVQNHSLPRRTA